ncbi:MAG TPA: choice-of-anchor J domain-containing protein [Crocinitomicaceae bacterium]|nr:choice-of-anchor J domain-containing protein [Crocinitomicaceae bacterium]
MKHTLLYLFSFLSFTSFSQDTILNENFENGIPSTWTILNQDGFTPHSAVSEYTNAWISVTDPFDTTQTNNCASATSYFVENGNANRWLITPALTLASFGNVLTFKAASFDPSFPEDYTIKIGTDLSKPETFTTLLTYIAETPYWSEHTLEFDTLGYNNETIYIAFVLATSDGFKFYLDDVSFQTEVALATKNLTETTFQLYPNPAKDVITITSNAKKEIFSITGEKLLETQAETFDISALNSGIYFVKIENSAEILKFVKE